MRVRDVAQRSEAWFRLRRDFRRKRFVQTNSNESAGDKSAFRFNDSETRGGTQPMNKRSLIQIAVVGIALGAALVSAFPTLVDALRLASAQAATLPANERRESIRSSFVFPGKDSASENTSSEAPYSNRANSTSTTQQPPFARGDRFAEPSSTSLSQRSGVTAGVSGSASISPENTAGQANSDTLSSEESLLKRAASTQTEVRFRNQAQSRAVPASRARDGRSVRFVFPVPRDSSGDSETRTTSTYTGQAAETMDREPDETQPAQISPYSSDVSVDTYATDAKDDERRSPVRFVFPDAQERSETPADVAEEDDSEPRSVLADRDQRSTEMEGEPDETAPTTSSQVLTEQPEAPAFQDDGFDPGTPLQFAFPGTENHASDSTSNGTNRDAEQPSDSPAVDHSATAIGHETEEAVPPANREALSEVSAEADATQPTVRNWRRPSWFALLVPQRQRDDSSAGATVDDYATAEPSGMDHNERSTSVPDSFRQAAEPQAGKLSTYLTGTASHSPDAPCSGQASPADFTDALDASHPTALLVADQTGAASSVAAESVRRASIDQPFAEGSTVQPASAALPESRAELSVLPAVDPDEEPASLNAALATSFSHTSSSYVSNIGDPAAKTVPAGYQALAARRYRSENPAPGNSLPALVPEQNQRRDWPIDKPLPPRLGDQHPSGTTPATRNRGQATSRTQSNSDQIRFPWEKDGSAPHGTPQMAQAQPDGSRGDTVTSDETSQPDTPAAEPLPLAPGAEDDTQQGGANNEEEPTLGEAPEDTEEELLFIRNQSILLEPGDYQCEVGFQYLMNEADFTFVGIRDNLVNIAEARRRQRLLLVPVEFRLGLSPVTQLTVNVPFGWSNSAFLFAGEDDYDNRGGIGDVNVGITRMLIEGTETFPDVLAIVGFSAPTGASNFLTSLAVPGSSLGQGFWTVTAGLTCIQTIDPVVFFYGMGYQHRFENSFDNGITVNPGKQIFYQLGAGFAINPRVTLSAAFTGSFFTEDYVNGTRIAGSIREPMSIRLAATVGRAKKQGHWRRPVKFVEPFCTFGLTEDANNVIFGVSWTR